ncbi:hypothetical protein [Micromonospora avicenniae]|uniref:hypothetical protein n=1 Tax=Micromonospora avicenniae TaxID=1198245 RepID=UPI003320DFA5
MDADLVKLNAGGVYSVTATSEIGWFRVISASTKPMLAALRTTPHSPSALTRCAVRIGPSSARFRFVQVRKVVLVPVATSQ